MTIKLMIYLGVVICAIAFLPAILTRVLDPINIRRIKRHCNSLGVSQVEVQAWPSHYAVTFQKNGQKHYAKCTVKGRTIKWKGQSPGEF